MQGCLNISIPASDIEIGGEKGFEALNRLKYVWKNANHIDLKTLWKYLTNYLYLPRLKNEKVLLEAIADGVGKDLFSCQENFAYANGYDETTERYLGLKAGELINPLLGARSLVARTSFGGKTTIIQSNILSINS